MMSMLAERRAMQRRTALRTLGLGVSAATAGLVTNEAAGKKKGKSKDRCPRQVSACEAQFASYCADSMAQEECLAVVRECCGPLKTCDAGSAMECFIFRFLRA